ncbi:MAG: hypothetical protein A3K18_06475 [Lentisphaerae bacterium RIFOXYA12_64_32]|nr:MAG: hypothetical protein A3K18_06475 [Lentisphaerae bacterium RIFOXYA12_64_32]
MKTLVRSRILVALGVICCVASAVAAGDRHDGALHFDFINSESKIQFLADSTLHSFSGVAKEFTGFAEAAVENLEATAKGRLQVTVKSLTTDHAKRDSFMMEDLAEPNYPAIVFALTGVKVVSSSPDQRTAEMELAGTLDLHGKSKLISIPVHVELRDGKLCIAGRTDLSLADFAIVPHSFLFLKVKDKVTVEFEVVAAPRTP